MSTDHPMRWPVPGGGTPRPSMTPGTVARYTTRPHLPETWEAEPMPVCRLGLLGDVLSFRAQQPCAAAVVVTLNTSIERLASELQALVDMLCYGPDPQGPAAFCAMPGFRP